MKRSSSPAVDEEETAAMVPSPPPTGNKIDHDLAVERRYLSSSTTRPCWKTTTSGGVGVVIGTLLCLAFLVGTKWFDHDAVVSTLCMSM